MTIYNARIRFVAVGILAVMLKQQDNGKSKSQYNVASLAGSTKRFVIALEGRFYYFVLALNWMQI